MNEEFSLKGTSLKGSIDLASHDFAESTDPNGLDLRSQSSLRMRYEAEVAVLRKNHGDLEQIRRKMGLSRRKMCQFLLVDPSAWTRWTKEPGKVPPHIYKTLGLALQMQEFGGFKDPSLKHHLQTIEFEMSQLKAKLKSQSLNDRRWLHVFASFFIGIAMGTIVCVLLFKFFY